jgi:hypothetical protein
LQSSSILTLVHTVAKILILNLLICQQHLLSCSFFVFC